MTSTHLRGQQPTAILTGVPAPAAPLDLTCQELERWRAEAGELTACPENPLQARPVCVEPKTRTHGFQLAPKLRLKR